MTRLPTTRGTNELDKDDDVLPVSRAAMGGRLEGKSGRADVDRPRSLRTHDGATGAARMDRSAVARFRAVRRAGAREDRDVMSKSPLGYTEAPAAVPGGGSRPESSAGPEATGTAVAPE